MASSREGSTTATASGAAPTTTRPSSAFRAPSRPHARRCARAQAGADVLGLGARCLHARVSTVSACPKVIFLRRGLRQ
eukprot:1891661-Pleurochrysis_carterae.AAC.3